MISARALFIIASLLLCVPATGMAESDNCLNKVCFDDHWEVGETKLPFRGAALHEFIKLDMYTGALYLSRSAQTIQEALADVPKVLVLNYHRGIKVKWMNKVAKHQLKKNPEVDYDAIEDRVEEIGAAYQKMKKNDRYALVYEPGKGTTLLFNKEPIITIPGVDFQKAYLGIWISEYAVNGKFRDRLLGQTEGATS